VEDHAVVTHDEWIAARKELLDQEKEFTRRRDELSARRRALPWEAVDKEYVFEGPDGEETLSDLFAGRSQLIVYHFMFDPEWDEGCKSCSFWADNFDPNIVHLKARDVTMVAVSRAPFEKLAAYRDRMGWSFKWISSADEAEQPVYNYGTLPPNISEREGLSVFYRDGSGEVFHTYSAYARGIDMVNAAYHYLDLVPKGRDEEGERSQSWVRRHDEYGD
jgi:predicted dithiol-disulfide oxidoreductase (DUF899 family)